MVVGQEEKKTKKQHIPKIPFILFLMLCYFHDSTNNEAISSKTGKFQQGNHGSEVIDKVAFMETYQDREAP